MAGPENGWASPEQPHWSDQAPCVGRLDDFFPSKADDASSLRVRRARRVCLTQCPFRRECLEACFAPVPKLVVLAGRAGQDLGPDRMALKDQPEDAGPEGIWAATSPAERKATSSLPIADRIRLLLAWATSDHVGPFSPVSSRQEIV